MSPTILNERGYGVLIYTADHTPAHVHVKKAGLVARVQLEPVQVIDHTGYKSKELRLIISIVSEHKDTLLSAWDKLHPVR